MKKTFAICLFFHCFSDINAMNNNNEQPKNFLVLINREKHIIDLNNKNIPLKTLLSQVDELYKHSYEFFNNTTLGQSTELIIIGTKLWHAFVYSNINNILKNSFLSDVAMKDPFKYDESLMQFYPWLNIVYKRYISIIETEATPQDQYSIELQKKYAKAQFLKLKEAIKRKIFERVFFDFAPIKK